MTNEDFLDLIKLGLHDNDIYVHAEKLVEISKYARALKGDLDAHNESPNHFVSYINLTLALEDLERE